MLPRSAGCGTPPPTSSRPQATRASTRSCPRSNCGSKSSWPKPVSSTAGRPPEHSSCSEFLRETPRSPVSRLRAILSVITRRYIRRARADWFCLPCTYRWAGLGKVEELSTLRKRAFHERPPARLFSRQAAGVEGRDPARIADHPADAPGRERQSSRSRRPRLLRDRSRDRAARPRPAAQADLQDRRRAAAHRRQHLRLLRGDRRADLAETAGGASDRDALGGSPGASREARKSLSGRVGLGRKLRSFCCPTRFRVKKTLDDENRRELSMEVADECHSLGRKDHCRRSPQPHAVGAACR